MSNIVKFPKLTKPPAGPPEPPPAVVSSPAPPQPPAGRGFVAGVIRFVWVATVLVWPILKWVLSIEVFFQFVRMLYHWNTPGAYAGWTFLLHFAVLTAITYFVSIYKPKGI
nr:KleE stable inheritance protein [Bordetella pertussis]